LSTLNREEVASRKEGVGNRVQGGLLME